MSDKTPPPTVWPTLCANDARALIRFLVDVVGFEETATSIDPSWSRPSGGPGFALAFRCPDAASVDAVHDRVVALGHESHKAPWDAFWGQRYAIVHDPDGNSVELFARL